MKRTSAFLELAERIGNNIYGSWRVCNQLRDDTARLWFTEMFEPSLHEKDMYGHLNLSWLSALETSGMEDNQFRILCLLLAHEIWCDTIDTKPIK